MIILLISIFICVWFAACGKPVSDESNSGKEVSEIIIAKEPVKTEYAVGEEFSAEGGEITVNYTDETSETLSMTDSKVTVSEVNTTITDESQASAKKTVTVRFGGKSARFDITVSYDICTITLDYGQVDKVETIEVRKDSKVSSPETPDDDELIFENWYSDADLTVLYDFNSPVTEDFTLYAKWLEDTKYYEVRFYDNYAGAVESAPQKVKENEQAVKPTTDPERKGYEFVGWYADEACTIDFDFSKQIMEDTTVYAQWNKTVSGRNLYVFEAEDVNLNGKSGPGLSGTAGGPGMIQLVSNLKASNDRFVGYQYEMGCSLEFQFNSDITIDDATIKISLSAEMRDFDLDPQSYKMALNGIDIDYKTISFKNVPTGASDDVGSVNALPFKDYVVITNASLNEGMNVFSVTTTNDEAMSGTTILAKAPLVDCIKIETEAVLDWAAQLGLPKKNY